LGGCGLGANPEELMLGDCIISKVARAAMPVGVVVEES
jgi:hypothetical protein